MEKKIRSTISIDDNVQWFKVKFDTSTGRSHVYEFHLGNPITKKTIRFLFELAANGIMNKVRSMRLQERNMERMDEKILAMIDKLEAWEYPANVVVSMKRKIASSTVPTRMDLGRQAYTMIMNDHDDLRSIPVEVAFGSRSAAFRTMRDPRIRLQIARLEVIELDRAIPAKAEPDPDQLAA